MNELKCFLLMLKDCVMEMSCWVRGGGSTNNQKTPTLGELTKTRGGFGTQIGGPPTASTNARARTRTHTHQRGNLEPSKLKIHLSSPKLNQVRALKVHFGTKRVTKTSNEKLTGVLCCFKTLIEPNAPCGRWYNRRKRPKQNGQGLVLF